MYRSVTFVIIGVRVTERCDRMNLVPNTTCRRCHRQYPSFRSKCPYCGTKKVQEIRGATPETDSAVPGTRAAKSMAETINWQMLIGGVLLLAIIIVTIVMVSVNVGNDAAEQQMLQAMQSAEVQPTMVPPPTATPEPTPTPPPAITNVMIYLRGSTSNPYNEDHGFSEQKGDVVPMTVMWYPTEVEAVPRWTADTEGLLEFHVDGPQCDVELVGEPGNGTWVTVTVNEMSQRFYVMING